MSDSGSDISSLFARVIADAVDDYRGRRVRGEDPDLDEYTAWAPEAAEDLRRILQMIRSTPIAPPTLPKELGDFRLGPEIGRGGMGVVYEARQISLDRRVALKILPFAALVDAKQLQRFHNEARAAAGLDHPNVVKVYAVGQERGVHFIAMQFIDGRPLSELIRALHGTNLRPVDPAAPTADFVPAASTTVQGRPNAPTATRSGAFVRRAVGMAIQAAEALEHAHSFGVVHRDVKPGNLLVDAAGNIWVSDFGLAKMSDAGVELTPSGDVFGTLRYMSPEHASGKMREVNHRADVYAFGATIYELLTGQYAVPGTDKPEILRRVIEGEPEPPRRLNPAISADLETVVLKCLEKNPADRYPSAAALAADLRLILADQPIPTRPRSWLYRTWRRVKARRVMALAAVAAVAGVLIGAAMASRRSESPEQWRTERQQAIRMALSEDRTFTLREFGPNLSAFRWPMVADGQGSAKVTRRGLVLDTLGSAALFEMTPDVGADAYRFGVKITHEVSSGNARVGLYFGYQEHEISGGGRVGAYFSLGFADRDGPASEGNWYVGHFALRVHVFSESPGEAAIDQSAPVGDEPEFVPDPDLRLIGGWREVAAEVRPSGVRVRWIPRTGPEIMREIPAKRLKDAAMDKAGLFDRTRGLRYQFDPRSGIGVFLRHGSATVSEVTVGPTEPGP